MEESTRYGPGDRQIAHMLGRPVLRWILFAVFFGIATASLYVRVGLGWNVQVLPWYCIVLSLHGIVMMYFSSDPRSRMVYGSFATLVAATFSRGVLPGITRTLGIVETAAALVMLALLLSLSRDERFMRDAVLESPMPGKTPHDPAE